jgi:hypothetical protein
MNSFAGSSAAEAEGCDGVGDLNLIQNGDFILLF